MATTPNYGLTKPAATDNYNIDVFNGNSDIIDTALKSNSDLITEHKSDAAVHLQAGERDKINGAVQHSETNLMFKNYDLNSINIDTTGDSAVRGNWVTGTAATGHGTYPTSDGWHLFVQIDNDHFIRQFGSSQLHDAPNTVYTRTRYTADTSWTPWKNVRDAMTINDALTLSTAAPTSTLAPGKLWGVYDA